MRNLARKRTHLHYRWWRSSLGSTLSFLPCSGRSASLDSSSQLGSKYSAVSLTTNGGNVSLSWRKNGEFAKVLSGQSSYQCPMTSLRSSVSPKIYIQRATCQQRTRHATEAPCKPNHSTRVICFVRGSQVHSRWVKNVLSDGIWASAVPLASFNSIHLALRHGLVLGIIRHGAPCGVASSCVWTASIVLFTEGHDASRWFLSITELSSGSSGAPENSHIM